MEEERESVEGLQIDWRTRFSKRVYLVLFAVLIWTTVIGFRSFQMMRRDASGDDAQWRVYVLPAKRGRILDASGIPLAWSEREFDLVYRKPPMVEQIWQDMFLLSEAIDIAAETTAKRASCVRRETVVLKQGLQANDILRIRKLRSKCKRFSIRVRFHRYLHEAGPRIATWLGKTRQFGRREVGVSGVERKLNQELAGQDGRFRVMVDRYGNWVPGTWTQITAPREGFDRYVNFRVRQRAASESASNN